MKRSSFTISNFNDLQDEIFIDFKNLIYYPQFSEFENSVAYSFLFEISQLMNYKKVKAKRKKKERINKRVEKIEKLKRKYHKKSKIILSTLIEHETSLSRAAGEYYGRK